MFAVPYDPDEHEVHDIPFVHHLRRELNDELLFTYKHRRTGKWTVAAWVRERWGLMQDLAFLGSSPVGNPDVLKSLQTLKRGSAQGQKNRELNRQDLQAHEKRWAIDMNEEQAEQQDVREFLRRRTPGKHNRNKHWVVNQ
jgi:hypothetical protein